MDTNILNLQELRGLLRASLAATDKKVFVGFDGFVDKIKKAVRQRHGATTTYFDTIREFSESIFTASGKSRQLQIDTKRVKLGGNAPILSNALGRLGISTYCCGSMGSPRRHPAFAEMSSSCHVMSVLEPGLSDAIEFDDGKLIFSELDV